MAYLAQFIVTAVWAFVFLAPFVLTAVAIYDSIANPRSRY
jgi:hypothetical protein